MATLTMFTAGTAILSADVNANFTAINTEVAGASRTGYSSATAVGNITTGVDTLHTWTMPAGTLVNAGDGIEVWAWGLCASNANAKAFGFAFGTSGVYALNPVITAPNGLSFIIHVRANYKGTSDALVWQACHTVQFSNGTFEINGNDAMVVGAPTSDRAITLTGSATATDDIRMYAATIRTFRAP